MGAGPATRPTPSLAHSLARSLAHFVFANCPPEKRRAPGGAGPRPAHFVPTGAGCSALTRRSRDTSPLAPGPRGPELPGEQVGVTARRRAAAAGGGQLRSAGVGGLEKLLRPALPPRIWAPPPPGLPAGNGVFGGATPAPRPRVRQRVLPGPDFPEPGREAVKWAPPNPVCLGLPKTRRRQMGRGGWGTALLPAASPWMGRALVLLRSHPAGSGPVSAFPPSLGQLGDRGKTS